MKRLDGLEVRRTGKNSSAARLKRKLRGLRGRKVSGLVQRFETGPGVQAQMDDSTYTIDISGQRRRRVHLFGYVLSYSRRQYSLCASLSEGAKPVPSKNEDLLE